MKPAKSGKPPKKSGSGFNWTKVVIVMVCILFAGIMIISALGTGWLVNLKPAGNGDVAIVDLTIWDDQGRPVLTTDGRLYTQKSQEGNIVFAASPLTLAANTSSNNIIEKIPAYHPTAGSVFFGLYNPEFMKISTGLAGMKQGETKRISFDSISGLRWNVTEEEFNSFGGNFSLVQVGDQIVLAVMDSPTISVDDNTTPVLPLRTAQIKAKDNKELILDLQYDTADITIRQLSHGS